MRSAVKRFRVVKLVKINLKLHARVDRERNEKKNSFEVLIGTQSKGKRQRRKQKQRDESRIRSVFITSQSIFKTGISLGGSILIYNQRARSLSVMCAENLSQPTLWTVKCFCVHAIDNSRNIAFVISKRKAWKLFKINFCSWNFCFFFLSLLPSFRPMLSERARENAERRV